MILINNKNRTSSTLLLIIGLISYLSAPSALAKVELPGIISDKMGVSFFKIKKFLKENSMTEQSFVKNPEVTVGQLAKDAGAEIVSFVRLEVGEGIEVEEVDFAAEVAAQVQQSS